MERKIALERAYSVLIERANLWKSLADKNLEVGTFKIENYRIAEKLDFEAAEAIKEMLDELQSV